MLNLLSNSAASSEVNTPPLDLVTATPLVAFSQARQLRAAYAGDLFELRNQALNTALDIGVDANGWVDFAAAKAFCDLTTTNIHSVETWYDQSANANHATQANVNLQARYKYGDPGFDQQTSFQWFAGGYPAGLLYGTHYWTTGNVSIAEGSLYAIAVFNVKDWFQARSHALFSCNLSTTGGVALYAKSGGTAQDWFAGDALAFADGSNSGREPRIVGGKASQTVIYGTSVIMEWMIQDGGQDVIRLNGQIITSKANTAPVPAVTTQPLIIGGSGIVNEYIDGQIGEMMVWAGASIPTASERNAIYSNMLNHYHTSRLTAALWT